MRSSPPGLTLHVSERWRCGIASADKLRGIVPATVEGAAVACPGEPRPIAPFRQMKPLPASPATVTHRLPAENVLANLRGTFEREALPTESLTLPDALRRFASGQPVGRAVLTGRRERHGRPGPRQRLFQPRARRPRFRRRRDHRLRSPRRWRTAGALGSRTPSPSAPP